MSRDLVCPVCGARLAEPSSAAESDSAAQQHAVTQEIVLPRTVATDELGFVDSLPANASHPLESGDPVEVPGEWGPLSAFTTRPSDEGNHSESRGFQESSFVSKPETRPHPSSGDSISVLNLELSELPLKTPRGEVSDAAIAPMELSGTDGSTAGSGAETRHLTREAESWSRADDGNPPFRGGLGQLILLSYASAMTLACLWMAWQLRNRPAAVDSAPSAGAPARGEIGASRSPRFLAATASISAIPSQRLTRLGVPIRVGHLEVAPLEITTMPVTLEQLDPDGQRSTRHGGGGVLVLALRLTNLSQEHAFTPIEPESVRDPILAARESFIETGDGLIPLYPLTMDSPWSIVGQEFRAMGPGESFETILASDREAVARVAESMTWRLPVRTGPDPEDVTVIGVRFRRDEIH